MRKTVFYFLILSSFFFLLSSSSSAQSASTFLVKEKGTVENITPYNDALQKADMSKYRLLAQRVQIKFDTELIAELFSAKELLESGIIINLNEFNTEFDKGFEMPVFSLGENGFIIANYHPRVKQ